MLAEKNNLRTTRDLALATWMRLQGLHVVRARREHKHQYEFMFRDHKGIWDQLTIEFVNSDCRQFDDEMRALKKLAGNGYSE